MRALSAVDLKSGQVLWSHPSEPIPFTSQMRLWPSFIDDDVVFLSGGAIYAINRVDLQTGATRWETESIYVSNFALDDSGKLYAMRQDGVLVVLDVNTGDTLDEIQFSGPKINPGYENYSVVVANSHVVVNFIDTQEIIALKMPPVR
jgi:outer membrane protein assembly factor BamB